MFKNGFMFFALTVFMGCLAHTVKSNKGVDMENLVKSGVETIPDFPKKGVSFQDITGLLKDPQALQAVIDHLAFLYADKDIDYVAGLEARGFILGAPLALKMQKPFIPVRKKGKLPRPTHSQSYKTEYSEDQIEISGDFHDQTILIVDDLLATGGTMKASIDIFKNAGAKKIFSICLIELLELKGREKLESDFLSIVKY